MSCSSHLPPRSPIQNKSLAIGSASRARERDNGLQTEHDSFSCQGSFFDEQTLWLDDLLINSKPNSQGNLLQRSASDPVALLASSSTFHSPVYLGSEGNAISTTDGSETDGDFEADSLYGPNSPRQKNELTHSESMVVSALLENASEYPCQHLFENYPAGSKISHSDDINNSSCDRIPGKSSRR